MKLNNKGQSLVLFVLIIPILIGIMAMVIDIGNVVYNRQDLDNINKIVLEEGLNDINNPNVVNEIQELAKLNNKDIIFKVKFSDMEFYIESSYYVKGIFSNIFDTNGYLVKSIYKGYIDENNKHIIKKIK